MARRRRKSWAQSIGPYGRRIRLFEDPASGIIQAEFRDRSKRCGYRQRSLRHRDRKRAVRWAYEQLAKLEAHEEMMLSRSPHLGWVLSLYLAHQSPKKVVSEQKGDARRADLWIRYLGESSDLRRVSRHKWDSFIELRKSGALDCRGYLVPFEDRRPVRDATVGGDLIFLRGVIRWAMRWQGEDGRYLLSEDPTRGFQVPIEKNPRRPVATTERYEIIQEVASQVEMVVSWGEQRVSRRSHLSEVLCLVHHTGRRLSAVLALRYDDLRLDEGPFGSIRWPKATDKLRRETVIPISQEVRTVLDGILRDRPGIGAAPLFPSPKDPTRSASVYLARHWLLEAEALAGVEKHDGSLWHAYRRGWATARKHLSDVDVAEAGGWTDTATLKAVYQQPDNATLFKVVSEPLELREA